MYLRGRLKERGLLAYGMVEDQSVRSALKKAGEDAHLFDQFPKVSP